MKYATAYDEKGMARALGVSLPISMKKSVELCNFIRGRELRKAITLLGYIIDEKIALPMRRYISGGTGHKPGVGPGRYPKKTCAEFIKLLKQAEANAKQKGLDVGRLVIKSILANKAEAPWHYGRHRGRKMKRAHIEVVVAESGPSGPLPKQQGAASKKTAKKMTAAAAAAATTETKLQTGAN